MIFPILRGLVAARLAPFTYLFLALNLLVFSATFESFAVYDEKLDGILGEKNFIQTQGSAFSYMILTEPATYSSTLAGLARKAVSGDRDSKKVLGSLALRNERFMSRATTYPFVGDEVALKEWRVAFGRLLAVQAEHPTYQWGLSHSHAGWMQYVTYQFAHSGGMHLFWNMIFLLIFGIFVELELGSSLMVLTFIGSGLIGAVTYVALSGLSASPLVGASASVSGLISLVGLHRWREQKLEFFYWLLPVQGYFGFVRLPSWVIVIVLLLPDLSGYLSSTADFGSVAFAAHIGGALFGAFIAVLLRWGWLKLEVEPSPPVKDHREPGARGVR